MDKRIVDPADFSADIFNAIGRERMLVGAVKPDGSFNAMTASWGGMGVLWNKNVFTCFVRPQRFTHEFTESADKISMAFFGREYRAALDIFGSKSGRDTDKFALSGLTPIVSDGYLDYAEASLTLFGKTVYKSVIDPEKLLDKSVMKLYKGDYHTVYVCEIEKIIEKEDNR